MTSRFRANREDLKVGSLVRAGWGNSTERVTGVITSVEETQDLFSEKYAILETNILVHVLCDGVIRYFDLDEDSIEVINESQRT